MTIRISSARDRAAALAEYEARVMADARRRCAIAAQTPVIAADDFAALLREDKAAAAAALAQMNDWQREVQAQAHAAWLNNHYALTGDDLMMTEAVLDNFARGIAQYQAAQPERTVCGVPVEVIEGIAQERVEQLTAESHDENRDAAAHARRRVNAVNKALLQVLDGAPVRETMGDYLIGSATRGGVVHRVSHHYGCSCEAGVKNQPCWHAEVADILATWLADQTAAAAAA